MHDRAIQDVQEVAFMYVLYLSALISAPKPSDSARSLNMMTGQVVSHARLRRWYTQRSAPET
jgi:hypothetical protein